MKQDYYMGLDIGGTKCAVSVCDVQGDTKCILERKEVSTESSEANVKRVGSIYS